MGDERFVVADSDGVFFFYFGELLCIYECDTNERIPVLLISSIHKRPDKNRHLSLFACYILFVVALECGVNASTEGNGPIIQYFLLCGCGCQFLGSP